jgi:hypothetical protein
MVNNLFIADVPPKNGEQNEKPDDRMVVGFITTYVISAYH